MFDSCLSEFGCRRRQGKIQRHVKLFGTVVLSAAVAFLSFHVKPSDLDPRFGLGIGGIFAVVASNFVLSSMLPETHEVTMGEALLLLTIAGIFSRLVLLAGSIFARICASAVMGRPITIQIIKVMKAVEINNINIICVTTSVAAIFAFSLITC